MADNTRRNIKEEEEYLKLQKQINESIKSQITSFKDVGSYAKMITENFADMQKLSVKIKETNLEIAKLEDEKTKESLERAAILKQEVAELDNQRKQLAAINKQMAGYKNLTKVVYQGLLGYLKDAVTGYLEFDQKARDAAANIGLGNQRMYMMRGNLISASVNMQKYGVSITDAVAAQQAYTEELGRSVILSDTALTNMAQIGKATGLGMAGMAGLTAQMEAFGLGAETSSKFIFDMYSESTAMGLNSGKVIKKFQENLSLLNKLNFKSGVAGLKEMAKFSEKFKLDMNSVAAVADKVFRPEGAIEAAAQLQVLGGSLAAMGDPFQLMYKARNAPEELAKSLTKAAVASATFNSKTGEFEVNAYELDRLREGAQALGMDYQELVQTAKQGAKINMLEGMLSSKNLKDTDREALAMMTQMVDGKAMIQTGFDKDGKAIMKEIKGLSQTELMNVLEKKKEAEESALQATGMKEQWDNLLNQFIVGLYPLLESLQKDLKPIADRLVNFATFLINGLKSWLENPIIKAFLKWGLIVGALAKVFGPFLSPIMWMIKGRMLASGFNSGVAKGPLGPGGKISKVLGGGGAGAGGAGAGGAMSPAQQMMSGKGAQAAGMGNMMKSLGSAAQILALAGALWILSEALINFNKVEWSSLAKAGVAMIGFSLALQSLQPTLSSFGTTVWPGIGAMLALGVATLMLSGSLLMMSQVPLPTLITSFIGLTAVLLAFSALAPVLAVGTGVLLGFGGAMLMIGGAIAIASLGFSVLVDSFTKMFAVIGPNGDSVLKAGLGFLSMAAGIGVLSLALMSLSGTALLAVVGLGVLLATTSAITSTATALTSAGGGEGISKTIQAINSVDTNKLEALKSLSVWMSLLGASTTIKFDENLKVAGSIEIKGEAGGKTNTDWINDPIFVSKLKNKIQDSSDFGTYSKPNSRPRT